MYHTWVNIPCPLFVPSGIPCNIALHMTVTKMEQLNCLFNTLFSLATKKTSKFVLLLAFCKGTPPLTGGFPSQRASDAESLSMSWCHVRELSLYYVECSILSSVCYNAVKYNTILQNIWQWKIKELNRFLTHDSCSCKETQYCIIHNNSEQINRSK